MKNIVCSIYALFSAPIRIAAVLAAVVMAAATVSCDDGDGDDGDDGDYVEPTAPVTPPTEGDRVTINGTIWATRNVGAPGTFAADPQDFGMLYQWGRPVGWSTVDPLTSTPDGEEWEAEQPLSDSWAAELDPCPEGWRVPTKTEIETLTTSGKVSFTWGTLNGVRGASFADKATKKSIFLPASHGRLGDDHSLNHGDVGSFVQCWSSSPAKVHLGNYHTLCFSSFGTEPSFYTYNSCAHSVRCVADE